MRLFLGIRIPNTIRDSLQKFKTALTTPDENVKWIAPDNLHLTLKFFGEVEQTRLETLENALHQSVIDQKRFSLQVQGTGFFPREQKAKVLWAGIQDPSNGLNKIADSIEKFSVQAGFPPNDNPFSAHLTMARFSSPPAAVFLEKIRSYRSFLFGEMEVKEFFIIQSQLRSSGSDYTLLKKFDLNVH